MQNHHISGGRTHQKDAISFHFLEIGHAPFSTLERGKNLKFQRIRIMPVMLGMKRKLVISRIRKNTCSAFIYSSDHNFQEIHQIKNLVNNMLQQNDLINCNEHRV